MAKWFVSVTAVGAEYLSKLWRNVVPKESEVSSLGLVVVGDQIEEKDAFGQSTYQKLDQKKLGSTNLEDGNNLFCWRVRRQPARAVSSNSITDERFSRVKIRKLKNEERIENCVWDDSKRKSKSSHFVKIRQTVSVRRKLSNRNGNDRSSRNSKWSSSHFCYVKPVMSCIERCLINHLSKITCTDLLSVQIDSGSIKAQCGGDEFNPKGKIESGVVLGIPPLHGAGLTEISNKSKRKCRGKSSNSNMGPASKAPAHYEESFDRMKIFSLGFATGVVSTSLSRKREVDNLVQKLEEDVMKHSVNVNELGTEAWTQLPHYAEDKSQHLSKLEAEVKAELEKLELNLKTGPSQIDLDQKADLSQGQQRMNSMTDQHDPGSDTDVTPTMKAGPHGNVLSPKELSLRLHELIKSRLEDRIADLETALQDSQRCLHLMEAENRINSKSESFSNKVMALDEFTRIEETEEGNPQSTVTSSECIDDRGSALMDHSLFEYQIGEGANVFSPFDLMCEENGELWSFSFDEVGTWEQISSSCRSSEDGESKNEREDEIFLIKKIVDKIKQGAPAAVNARRMLLSLDE